MKQKELAAKIISQESGKTVLEIAKQRIIVKNEVLPEPMAKGKVLRLYLVDADAGVAEDKKLAKTILEEILNGK